MAVEMAPELQIAQSQTPAITKAALIAAEQAKQQAAQQEAMMRQVMSMFAPGGMPGQQSLGNMMQPVGGAAGATVGHPDEGLTHNKQFRDPMIKPPSSMTPRQMPQEVSGQTQQQATRPQQPQVSRQAGPSAAPRTR